jgi:two-component system response regulator FixJ
MSIFFFERSVGVKLNRTKEKPFSILRGHPASSLGLDGTGTMVNQEQRQSNIFFVDDEPAIYEIVELAFSQLPYTVTCFPDGFRCLEAILENRSCDVLVIDVNMPGMNGLDLMVRVKKIRPLLPVLIITGLGNVPLAVKAIQLGASDFIEKPFLIETLVQIVEKALFQSPLPNPALPEALTRDETRILKLLVEGKCFADIASRLAYPLGTVENIRNDLMLKLKAKNLGELIRKAVILNLIDS